MGHITAGDVFDVERFVEDVNDFIARHGVTLSDLARSIGMHLSTAQNALRYNQVTLRSACLFASVADLSLDEYRVPQEFDVKLSNPLVGPMRRRLDSLEERVQSLEMIVLTGKRQ